jgi:hypothetical protein
MLGPGRAGSSRIGQLKLLRVRLRAGIRTGIRTGSK